MLFKNGKVSQNFREYGIIRGMIGVFAVHGGGIEAGTEQIVRNIVERTNCSAYIFSGRMKTGNRNSDLYIPSHKSGLRNRTFFKHIVSHVETVISIHGHGYNDGHVYIGGKSSNLKNKIRESLKRAIPRYRIITSLHEVPYLLRGNYSKNFVNVVSKKGVQIELPITLRKTKKTTGWNRHEWSELCGNTLKVANVLGEIINSA
jgi:phage replication-related protein YjqB (UPF0714/DUF867 family)